MSYVTLKTTFQNEHSTIIPKGTSPPGFHTCLSKSRTADTFSSEMATFLIQHETVETRTGNTVTKIVLVCFRGYPGGVFLRLYLCCVLLHNAQTYNTAAFLNALQLCER